MQESGPDKMGMDDAAAEEVECQQARLVAMAFGNLDQWRDLRRVKEAQANDETLAIVLNWVHGGRKSSDFERLERRAITRDQAHYNAQLDMLKIDSDGILRQRQPNGEHLFPWREDQWLPCLPEELWPTACRVAHEHLGRLGVDRSLHLLASQVYSHMRSRR